MIWQMIKELLFVDWMALLFVDKVQVVFRKVNFKIFLREIPITHFSRKRDLNSLLVMYGGYNTNEGLGHPQIIVLGFQNGKMTCENVNLAELPLSALRSLRARKEMSSAYYHRIIRSLPLVFLDLFELDFNEEEPCFKFLDEDAEPFAVIDEEQYIRVVEAEKVVGDIFWNIIPFREPLPRVRPEVIYIDEEDSFFMFGGFVPIKFLPDSFIDACYQQIMRERSDIERQTVVEKIYCPTNDLWKLHIKENRWELISPLTYLVQSPKTGKWCHNLPNAPGYTMFYSFHCPVKKKMYFLTPKASFRYKSEFLEYDYSINKHRRVGDFDIDYVQYGITTSPLVDESNNTVIFLGSFNKLLVICLETFKSTEIYLRCIDRRSVPTGHWHMILVESGKTLAFIEEPRYLYERESVNYTFYYSSCDREQIKREKVNPFLRKHRNISQC